MAAVERRHGAAAAQVIFGPPQQFQELQALILQIQRENAVTVARLEEQSAELRAMIQENGREIQQIERDRSDINRRMGDLEGRLQNRNGIETVCLGVGRVISIVLCCHKKHS